MIASQKSKDRPDNYNFSNWIYLAFFLIGLFPAVLTTFIYVFSGQVLLGSMEFWMRLSISGIVSCFFTLIISFFVYNFLKLLQKKHPWEQGIMTRLVLEIIGTYSISIVMIILLSLTFNQYFSEYLGVKDNVFSNMVVAIVMNSVIVSVVEGAFFFRQWKYSLIEAERFKKESIKSKYESLKNQVNPHFLFNNLNTLSSLIDDDNIEAKEFVDDFSDVYRYVLMNRDKELVTLKEELDFIEAYKGLLGTRHKGKFTCTIEVPDAVKNRKIPPLTLQLLVENAVKHNITSINKPLNISLTLNGNDKLVIENNLQRKPHIETSTGIGLQNIQKRYQYLTDQTVDILETDKSFIVKVPLI